MHLCVAKMLKKKTHDAKGLHNRRGRSLVFYRLKGYMNTTQWMVLWGLLFLVMMLGPMGCLTTAPDVGSSSSPPVGMVLLPGDEIEINVFGVPELNTVQRIRPDGKISAKLFGDFTAAGKTPMELRDDLTQLYESQIQIKAITVLVRSSAVVYVTGAVGHPGKVDYLRPMTALEAIMEAGGFDSKAGAQRGNVRVVRTENNQVKSYPLNFNEILMKGGQASFYLKPFDTVYVPGGW
jgi:polysaccharide export outer membrane protein